jgi:hypothetical protein
MSSFFDSMIIVGGGKVYHGVKDIDKQMKKETSRMSAYEKTKAEVYATGNKWAIENFHATHD